MLPKRLIAFALIVGMALFASRSTVAQQATPPTTTQQAKPQAQPMAPATQPTAKTPEAKPAPVSPEPVKTARREEPATIVRLLHVEMSGGELLALPRPAASVFIADPTIADVQ